MLAKDFPFATKFLVKDTGSGYWLMRINVGGLWTRLIKGMDDGGLLCMNHKGDLVKVFPTTEVVAID